MKLNGWHRLWLLLCIIYLAVVVSYVVIEFPKAKNIQHSAEFYRKLSKTSAEMIIPTTYEDVLMLGGKDITGSPNLSTGSTVMPKLGEIRQKYPEYNDMTDKQLADALYSKYYSDMPKDEYYKKIGFKGIPEGRINVEMPNGHTIAFKDKFSKKEMEVASQEYWRIVEQKATEKRVHFLLYAFLFWLVPCIGLYALGWGISWVYKGFKLNKTAQQANQPDRE